MSTFTRTITIKEDENGMYVLFKPQFESEGKSFPKGKFTVRPPSKRNSYNSADIEPFKVGEKVQVQVFNANMGWYKIRRKGEGGTTLWGGPRWQINGFSACWVEQ